jgi:pyruvate dehydrogenase E1 component alpha subunit
MSEISAIVLWKSMTRIRLVEEAIAEAYQKEEMRCPMHLSIGQELVGAAAGCAMQVGDMSVSSHRAHAHYLGKGGSLRGLISELHGKQTGCSGGVGGSMHLCAPEVGFMGSTAIVGNSIPVGVGLALAIQTKKLNQIVCVHIGEGAVEEGVFYESVNFAAVRELPVLFLCENNKYSVYSSLSVRQPQGRHIWKMVEAMGVKSVHLSSVDAEGFTEKLTSLVEEIRQTKRPLFIETDAYRWREHCGPNFDDELNYRPPEEVEKAREVDPLNVLTQKLINQHQLSDSLILEYESKVKAEIESCMDQARRAPWPDYNNLEELTYAGGK